jgi:hypothetical protein
MHDWPACTPRRDAQERTARIPCPPWSPAPEPLAYLPACGPQSSRGVEVSGEEFAAAEPDVLRKAAPDLINNWNRCAELPWLQPQHNWSCMDVAWPPVARGRPAADLSCSLVAQRSQLSCGRLFALEPGSERVEDIYRIVSDFLSIPLTEVRRLLPRLSSLAWRPSHMRAYAAAATGSLRALLSSPAWPVRACR